MWSVNLGTYLTVYIDKLKLKVFNEKVRAVLDELGCGNFKTSSKRSTVDVS